MSLSGGARRDVAFPAGGGTLLRGWFYQPAGTGRFPTIVISHGFASLKEQYLDRFAEVFAAGGFACLVYDHRNFGASDGLPRNEIDPYAQMHDMRDAITFACSLPEVDSTRIGIWGTSYSGGHALMVAAVDRRVKCVVASVPLINGFANASRRVRPDLLPAQLAMFNAERQALLEGKPPTMVPVISQDPGVRCAQPGQEAWDNFHETLKVAPDRPTHVTLRTLEMLREYDPGSFIARIAPTPLLMIVATADHMSPTDLALDAYERALQPKKLLLVEGGHYVCYRDKFDWASQASLDWYQEHLG